MTARKEEAKERVSDIEDKFMETNGAEKKSKGKLKNEQVNQTIKKEMKKYLDDKSRLRELSKSTNIITLVSQQPQKKRGAGLFKQIIV